VAPPSERSYTITALLIDAGCTQMSNDISGAFIYFSIAQSPRTLPWQPILGSKSAMLADSHSFVAPTLRNGLEYRISDVRVLNDNGFSTFCLNLVRFGPVNPEFTKVVGVLVDQEWN